MGFKIGNLLKWSHLCHCVCRCLYLCLAAHSTCYHQSLLGFKIGNLFKWSHLCQFVCRCLYLCLAAHSACYHQSLLGFKIGKLFKSSLYCQSASLSPRQEYFQNEGLECKLDVFHRKIAFEKKYIILNVNWIFSTERWHLRRDTLLYPPRRSVGTHTVVTVCRVYWLYLSRDKVIMSQYIKSGPLLHHKMIHFHINL